MDDSHIKLPNEVQSKVSMYMVNKRKSEERKAPPEIKSIKVPIPTFPPTAMVYSIPKSPNTTKNPDKETDSNTVDIVSAAIMAKVLEERERERSCIKHCDTCTCSTNFKIVLQNSSNSVSTQTKALMCLKCNYLLETVPVITKVLETNLKNVPVYIHNQISQPMGNQIVAKVQPNNFLIDIKREFTVDTKLKHSDNKASSTVTSLPQASLVKGCKEVQMQEIVFFKENEKIKNIRSHTSTVLPNIEEIAKAQIAKRKEMATHHHLCDKFSPSFQPDLKPDESNINIEQLSANNSPQASDNLKGPRYCSVRLQTGSKNVLLDNAHNNIAPVMYTRHNERKKHDLKSQQNVLPNSCSTAVINDTSFQNQRVADWIKNNLDITPISSENAKSESVRKVSNEMDPAQYAKMENNVKKFLFGENNFYKTVELEKLKYQNYQDTESSNKNSQTETDI